MVKKKGTYMKKLGLLVLTLLLSSCGTWNNSQYESVFENTSSQEETRKVVINDKEYEFLNVYTTRGKNGDGFFYWFHIDYLTNGSLIVSRREHTEAQWVDYKSYGLGHYVCESCYNVAFEEKYQELYDYGDFAIWVKNLY